jgi:hypothetical protein
MADSRRPYFVTYKGVRRLVEAANPGAAAHHVVGPDITELRPARASEVSQWYRGQFPVDVAGERGRPLTQGVVLDAVPAFLNRVVAAPLTPVFSAGDARDWLGALEIFDRMRERGTMELHDFEALQQVCPPLVEAIASGQGVDMTQDAMRDGESIDFQDVVTAIETFRRRAWQVVSDATETDAA